MNYNYILFTSLVTLTLIGCTDNGASESEIKSIKAELEQVKAKYINLEKEHSNEINLFQTELTRIEKEYADLDNEYPNKLDRNNDGKHDFFIESDDDFVFELVDRNFDGKVDESWKYDDNDDLVSGKVDEDLDGVLETQYIQKNYSLDKVLSDTNKNGIFDVYTKLDYGVMVYSEKYYFLDGKAQIGKINYLYGYPTGPEKIVKTTISEKEFETARK